MKFHYSTAVLIETFFTSAANNKNITPPKPSGVNGLVRNFIEFHNHFSIDLISIDEKLDEKLLEVLIEKSVLNGALSDPNLLEMERLMKRNIVVLFVVAVLAMLAVIPASANRGDGALGVVYVSSQGLYYDTFVSANSLPMKGRFQLLENGVTEFGPGDQGYVGGRWWIDDGNGIMDENDTFLLCPLLGPGRTSP